MRSLTRAVSRDLFVNVVTTFFVSTALFLGAYLSFDSLKSVPPLILVFGYAVSSLCVYGLLALFWKLLDRCQRAPASNNYNVSARLIVCCGCLILVCWFLVLLAGYPGFSNYDGIAQWNQFANGKITSHHPVLHTLFLGFTISLGQSLFGSFQGGILLSVSVQGIIIAGILVWSLVAFSRLGMGSKGLIAATCFYALNPILALLALSTTKDSLFSAFVLAYVLEIALILRGNSTGGKTVLLTVTPLALLVCLLRLNAAPALAISSIMMALVLWKNRQARFVVCANGIAIGLLLVISGPLFNAAGIGGGSHQSWNALAVPMQQVARCYTDSGTAEEDVQRIRERIGDIPYRKNLSDIARGSYLKSKLSKQDFFSLYVDFGLKYPVTYLKALLYQTEDAWSPFSRIDAYAKPVTETYGSTKNPTSVFEFAFKEVDVFHRSEFDSKLPAIKDALVWLSSSPDAHKMPFVRVLVGIWPLLLSLLLCLARCIMKRDLIGICIVLPLAVLALTNLVGPCMLIRYFYYLLLALPLIAFMAICAKDTRNDKA